VNKGVWEEAVRKDAYKEVVGSHDRCEERVYAMKREGVPLVKRREGGDERVCKGAVEKGLYPAIEVTADSAGVFCRKKGWEEEDGTGLPVS